MGFCDAPDTWRARGLHEDRGAAAQIAEQGGRLADEFES